MHDIIQWTGGWLLSEKYDNNTQTYSNKKVLTCVWPVNSECVLNQFKYQSIMFSLFYIYSHRIIFIVDWSPITTNAATDMHYNFAFRFLLYFIHFHYWKNMREKIPVKHNQIKALKCLGFHCAHQIRSCIPTHVKLFWAGPLLTLQRYIIFIQLWWWWTVMIYDKCPKLHFS